ncbi:hypothetical protein AYR54_08645 [Loigolactobacillus backii]|uniref:acetyl-CoA carboxylase biotin carboxyl carrier protein n=1 Tax=Loigolactobacillus backii TaxID=375175 RepID=UPI0007F0617E|nr:biotin/lipoyl-containing protein [Loigolactobacillus backii]ANK60420.1 hypothetical protein AYR52_09240 [Loigolactobacillus backii]ANK65299.1 hypothetical protein AYR54_08645 [Loigolactobacillus backii]ANK67860.1 hypothetical protein AYR55_09255 [Loigolactobacillus backii]OLF69480.1 hypothetical protein ACX53_07725 [Loigolactobacillus backii]PIO86917.1 acetyl-CoA carboxylase biotin carboxyl carrier protein subunit [Loigolactobacillus backii]
MNVDEIKALMDHMAASNLTSFTYQNEQTTLKLTKEPSNSPQPESTQPTPALEKKPADAKLTLKSPLVGVFYASASPDEPPFVKTGDNVEVGQTIGIIEAMKMMHDVKADKAGKVTQILVGNQQRVGYDDPLFELD